jgi:hypothetical protein
MWWLPQTSGTHIWESRWFKLMYTLQGKTRSTRHVLFSRQSMYVRHTLPVGSLRTWQPITSHWQIWTDPTAPEENGSQHNPQHAGWPIRGSVPSFSPKPTNDVVDLSQAYVDDKLPGLLDPYHQHAIGMFNTCSWGPTHQSLTDTSRSYSLYGADFPHTTPRPSQPMVLSFPPKGLALSPHYSKYTIDSKVQV